MDFDRELLKGSIVIQHYIVVTTGAFISLGWLAELKKSFLLAAATLVLAVGARGQAQLPPQNLIHVEISGLRNDKGKVMCALFSSTDDFPKKAEKAIARTQSTISKGQAVYEFSAVAPDTYAVSVFHDENSNGKLDKNLIGMPREGVGASNNAKGYFGPRNSTPLPFAMQVAAWI